MPKSHPKLKLSFSAKVLVPVVAAVGWARVILRDHTPAQSAAGCILGATVAAAVFSALR